MNATGERGPVPNGQRRWACKTLEIDPNLDERRLWGPMLESLQRNDFIPTPAQSEALAVLAPHCGRLNRDAAADHELPDNGADLAVIDESPKFPVYEQHREVLLRKEIDKFAQRYFSLKPSARKLQFLKLHKACRGVPALRAQLVELAKGLKVERPDEATDIGPAADLARDLCDLYVNRPGPHWKPPHTVLDRWCRDGSANYSLLKELQASYPEIAALKPEHLYQLRRRESLSFQQNVPLSTAAKSPFKSSPRGEKSAEESNSFSSFFVLIAIAATVLVGLLRQASKPAPAPAQPTWQNYRYVQPPRPATPDPTLLQQQADDATRRLFGELTKTRPEFNADEFLKKWKEEQQRTIRERALLAPPGASGQTQPPSIRDVGQEAAERSLQQLLEGTPAQLPSGDNDDATPGGSPPE